MKRHTKLNSQQDVHTDSQQQSTSQQAQEFANADEILRFDAEQTAVPPEVARRLQKSLASSAGVKSSWWKNLFGG